MADRLTLSCWLRGFQTLTLPNHLESFLKVFPYSRLSQTAVVCRVRAISYAEAPVFEDAYQQPFRPEGFAKTAREYQNDDVAFEVECDWDLLRFPDWQLAPTRVTLTCFGPAFDNEIGDHLRVDFGVEDPFLPEAGVEGSLHASQANLKSLTQLVGELSSRLPMERKHLWSESGVNFAEKLEQVVGLGLRPQ